MAFTALLAAGAVSLGANVADTLATPGTDWGAGLTALSPPVLGGLAVELLTRIRWPDTLPAKLAKWIGVSLVSLANALVSFWHVFGWLNGHCKYDLVTATAGAIGIDGLLLMSAAALLVTSPAFVDAQASAPGVQVDAWGVQVDAPASGQAVHLDGQGDQVDVPVDALGGSPVLPPAQKPAPGEETEALIRVAVQQAGAVNKAQLARLTGLGRTTVGRYLERMELAA